ncbi:MAG: beta-galactosidase [bacterium]
MPPLSHLRPASLNRFWFGAAYYPEHWDANTRAADPARMAAAGFNMVRMAEFAWNLIEPSEGHYDFTLFDEAIQQLGAQGIHTLLCTPTATPPRWLTLKHPEIAAMNENGLCMEHGSRQHVCHANPVFRSYSRAITRAMADHYRANPYVAGWQTDNELHCHFSECHCPSCQHAFQDFLRLKFKGDITALNTAWGTTFWAQTYDDFTAIPTPKNNRPTFSNPAHQLDYARFVARVVAQFQHDQVVTLRETNPRWFITHNGCMKHVDYRGEFGQDLDVLGYDCYPMFCTDPAERQASQAYQLDAVRAWSGNFMIPEHQSGPGGQQPYFQDHPEPGELRKMTYVSIAHGADSLLYFRWRTCRFGAEEYWCGILDHDNVPRRRYDEVSQVGTELKRIGPELAGTYVHVDVAIAGADLDQDQAYPTLSFGLPSHSDMAAAIHGVWYRKGYATGVIHPTDDLSSLKLYIIPHWVVFNPDWVPLLETFVRNGGTLVIGARTATRDQNNNVVPETLPGCLRELAGVTIEEYGRQNQPQARPLAFSLKGKTVTTDFWYESLKLEGDTKTLAKWSSRHLKGQPALSIRKLGKGSVVYVGTYMTRSVASSLLPVLAQQAGLKPLWPSAPTGVEIVLRQNDNQKLWFLINHNEKAISLKSPPRGIDLITGKRVPAVLHLKARDLAIIKQELR